MKIFNEGTRFQIKKLLPGLNMDKDFEMYLFNYLCTLLT